MDTIEYRTVDKSSWGEGPWQSEPDKRQWRDEATGLPCMIRRGPFGAWCGYVGVSEGHPFFRMDCDDVDTAQPHGGFTFAGMCDHGDEATAICHIPGPGESDHVWWLGFDCAHYGDLCPAYDWRRPSGAEYRDLSYVTAECARIAAVLAATARTHPGADKDGGAT